jgi:hypothetical protein
MDVSTLTERNREWDIGEGAYVCDKCQDDYEEHCYQEHLKERKATNLKVQGNHIQYILNKILGFVECGGYTGNQGKEDEYLTFELTDGAISTDERNRINIHYFWDYRLTVKNNLFTFQIVNRFDVYYIMKVLTEDQQKRILSYLGY